MNLAILKGRLGSDPRLFHVGETGKKVIFNIAVNRSFKRKDSNERQQETTWIPCEAWDTGAEYINEHFKKGDAILITNGSIKNDEWTTPEGDKRSKIFVRINSFEKLNFVKANNSDTTKDETKDETEDEKSAVGVSPEGQDINF